MRPLQIRLLTALVGALVLSALAASGRSARIAHPGAQLSPGRTTRTGHGADWATALAVSPEGTKVFVTGSSQSATGSDYATLAYDASSGKRLWLARYDGPTHRDDNAYALALSGDGRRLFVSGESWGKTDSDCATVAYNASTGKRLWAARYRHGAASALALSPDGKRLFVTGGNSGGKFFLDYATIAYDASTGKRLWVARYDDPGHGDDFADSLALSPDGKKVFVTGGSDEDYATLAYDAASGKRLWVARYDGPASDDDEANSLALSGDGKRVFVTGADWSDATGNDYATLAYDAASGRKLWLARYDGPASDYDAATALVANGEGTQLFVTGTDATLAYDAVTGKQLWVARYSRPANSLALSGDGRRLFVTGYSYATLAYDAATGERLWVARYNGPGNGSDSASALALSGEGKRVFVTGESYGGGKTNDDYATLAYNAQTGKKLWLARYNGPPFCHVPKLHGLRLAKAKALIREQGCAVGKIKRSYSQVKKGRVVSQKPRAGTGFATKKKVRLVVSRGPKPKRHHAARGRRG